MFSTRCTPKRSPLVVRASSASKHGPYEPENNKRDANPLSDTDNKDSLGEGVPSAGLAKTDTNKKGN